ncbi:MAG: PH domain-containing protein [Planctomycetota bacterium]
MLYSALRSVALRLMKTPIDPPEAPAGSHASVQIFRASPRYLTYRMLGYWIAFGFLWLVLLIGLIASLVERRPVELAVVVALGLVLACLQFVAYFATRLDFDQRYYVLTDRSLRVRSGAIVVTEMTVTHANVQNLTVAQGPLQKLFGIADLKVQTAGGGASQGKHQHDTGHSIQFAGIENASEVRDRVLAYLRQYGGKSAGLGDPDDHAGQGLSPRALAALRGVHASAAALRRAAELRM